MQVGVLVPVKGLDDAKQRLAAQLSPSERADLARWMADRVLAACHPLTVVVVCDDDAVASWAAAGGARVHATTARGLNAAVDDGVAAVAEAGCDHVVVAHADLPFPSALAKVARHATVTIVPDRHRDGTNVLSFPLSHRFPVSYGPGSFARHLAAATELTRRDPSVGVEVRADPDLALDVDTVDDLRHLRIRKVLPSWLPTNPDNPSRT